MPNGLGGFEPRFTCNLYLQTREQAYKVVQDMASIFRGMVYWSGGAITVTQDAPSDAVYPNSALVALRVDASQFSAIPRRSYDMKLLRVRVPVNYDPGTRTYSGVWNGTFKIVWTDNPAWCFYDLVTSTRYGLGGYIPESQVDKWALCNALIAFVSSTLGRCVLTSRTAWASTSGERRMPRIFSTTTCSISPAGMRQMSQLSLLKMTLRPSFSLDIHQATPTFETSFRVTTPTDAPYFVRS